MIARSARVLAWVLASSCAATATTPVAPIASAPPAPAPPAPPPPAPVPPRSCPPETQPVAIVVANPDDPDAIEPIDFECVDAPFFCSPRPLDASRPRSFTAIDSIDPRRCSPDDEGPRFEWRIDYPPSVRGGAQVISSGITGERSPTLHIAPHALPDLSRAREAFYRVALTITHVPTKPDIPLEHQQMRVSFRFAYVGSRRPLEP